MPFARHHRPQPSPRRAPALHALVLAMIVTFLPHGLYGCCSATDGAATAMPMPGIGAAMDCCGGACPMNHGDADACFATGEAAKAPDAVLAKSGRIDPDFAPTSPAETRLRPTSAPAWALGVEAIPHSPPVPLHLLNAQFLI